MERKLINVSFILSCCALSTRGIHGEHQRNLEILPILPGDRISELRSISCLNEKTLQLFLPGRCSYDLLTTAVAAKMSELRSCRDKNPDWEIMAMLNVDTVENAKKSLDLLCKDALVSSMKGRTAFEFDRFSNMDDDFNKAFFDGGSSWNDGGMSFKQAQTLNENSPSSLNGASFNFRGDSGRLSFVAQNIARKRPISWPGKIENFDGCAANSAMCCWVEHDESQDGRFKKNTDLCYVDYSRAPSSSRMESGLGIFSGLEDSFCHGFAWEDGSLDDLFKGNLLFLSEIYENMHNRGLSKNVPGAPMCGCVEQMPIVTRADCSKLEWQGTFIFRHSAFSNYTNLVIVSGNATPDVIDCDVAEGRTNDLGMYYQHLFLEGRVNETQKASFDKTVVGDGHCYTQIREIKNIFLFNATTESPTALPTIEPMIASPTFVTTLNPTLALPALVSTPTNQPYSHSSSQPSLQLSRQPSLHPAKSQPSTHSSNEPTPLTINQTSSQPSSQPSRYLSSEPSNLTTSEPSSQSSSHSSLQPSNSIAPTAPQTLPEFVHVGAGTCKSASNLAYDFYYTSVAGSTPQRCSNHCRKQEGFVGFHTAHEYYCYCLYEDGFLPKTICSRSRCYDQYGGIGKIAWANDGAKSTKQCYRYNWALPMMPSSQPSESTVPSIAPTISEQPSLSAQPSISPSFRPTTTSPPTFFPSTASPSSQLSTSMHPSILPGHSGSPSDG